MVAPSWSCTLEELRAALGLPPPTAGVCDHVPSRVDFPTFGVEPGHEDRVCECGKTRISFAEMQKCQFVWEFVALVRKAMGLLPPAPAPTPPPKPRTLERTVPRDLVAVEAVPGFRKITFDDGDD